jgi:uncharacterized protein (TIGR02246 family)
MTGEVNLEPVESLPAQTVEGRCPKCGAGNSATNRFCGYCGALMDRVEKPRNVQSQTGSEGQHVYHHHYHHHYFSEFEKAAAVEKAAVSENSGGEMEEPASGQAHEEAANAIQKLVQKWGRCFNSKRLDELMSLYSSDSIVLRPNASPAHGTEAIRQLMQTALDGGLGDVQLDCADIGIVGDFACLTGRSKMLVPTAPARRHEEIGKYLIVVRREGGLWKIVADSWCMDTPKAAPASVSVPVLPMKGQRR